LKITKIDCHTQFFLYFSAVSNKNAQISERFGELTTNYSVKQMKQTICHLINNNINEWLIILTITRIINQLALYIDKKAYQPLILKNPIIQS
jgi:hypothetical protein